MNKRSVTQHILKMALNHASQLNAQRITDLYLVTGAYSEATCSAIRLHWTALSRGTLAEGASMHMSTTPFLLKCSECGHTFELRDNSLSCPVCGSHATAIVGGDGCRLEAIQFE